MRDEYPETSFIPHPSSLIPPGDGHPQHHAGLVLRRRRALRPRQSGARGIADGGGRRGDRRYRRRVDAAAAGIDRAQILVDPGIGFGKTFEHNLELLACGRELQSIAPLVIGASRKAFIGHLTGRTAGPDRMAGSLAAIAAAHRAGAAFVRAHDVRETVGFLKVLAATAERDRSAGSTVLSRSLPRSE